jgi:lipoyl-dependent peroxiredoxin
VSRGIRLLVCRTVKTCSVSCKRITPSHEIEREDQVKILYEAKASASGGRNGRVRSSDGTLDLRLSIPNGMGGPGEALSNPEQLFAAGYAACFDNALAFVASRQGVALSETRVDATVGIGPRGTGGFVLTVRLEAAMPGLPREQAQKLLEAADAVCPYSNAIRGNVTVTLALV